MSIKRKISIKHTVQEALDNMDMEDVRKTPVFTLWAVRADQKIGSYYQYVKKIKVVEIKNCRVELPCEAVEVLKVVFGDQGCECSALLDAESCDCLIGWQIQNNMLVYSTDISETDTHVTIQYLAYETDNEGFPLVNENHIDAIAQYIEYQAAKATRWKSAEHRITEAAISEMKRETGRKIRHARAEDERLSPGVYENIAVMMNDPISGRGIPLYNYNG